MGEARDELCLLGQRHRRDEGRHSPRDGGGGAHQAEPLPGGLSQGPPPPATAAAPAAAVPPPLQLGVAQYSSSANARSASGAAIVAALAGRPPPRPGRAPQPFEINALMVGP